MGRGPDFLLVNPGGRTDIYQALGAGLAAIESPVWVGLIAQFLRRRGYGVEVLDANAWDLAPTEVAARVADVAPLLTVVVVYGHNPSASTQVMPAAGAICRALRERAPHLRSVLVGGHVAALPERTLREEAADFVAAGEGLYTLADLADALQAADPRLDRVRGLHYREGTAVRSGPPAPLVADLDAEMPGMAWDLLPMERYRAHNWHCFGHPDRQPYAALYTTLGCPYQCSFCCIQAPFKAGEAAAGMKPSVNSYRLWSPETILEQIDWLVERHGVRHLKIADEMFVLNRRHVTALCDGLIARGHDLNIWAYARVDTVADDMLEKLRRAGFRWLAFGIEAGSAAVRTSVRKGFDGSKVARCVEQVRAAGIHVAANYIFGLPEDDEESMRETLQLAFDLDAEWANFYCAMAYPGSALYGIAQRSGWPLPARWSGFSQHAVDTLPLPTRHVDGPAVLRFRDAAFDAYFSRPAYLDRVERAFGPQAVAHVREMAAHRLVRRHAAA
ncbi:MAG: radical SAM protein [Candidatus Binatia bacterium]